MASRKDIEHFKQKIKDIASRENIIRGIHNYCDRWCERCDFVSRCTVGISQFEIVGPEPDMRNKEFWEHLSVVFQASWEMIAEGAQEMGIDLKTDEPEQIKPIPHKSAAGKLAEKYGFRLLTWLQSHYDLFVEKAELFVLTNEKQLVSFQDALEVIRWYSLFIAVKIHRATLPPLDFDEKTDSQNDKNGSAKIAIIAVNRSLEAFSYLYSLMPEEEDEILSFLSDLSRIQKQLKKSFPDAMDFKRPGFDD